MPHFDGSGPTGRGPFTGGARGYCALRLEDDPQGALVGFIGKQGEPFSRPPHLPEDIEGDAPLLRAPLDRLLDAEYGEEVLGMPAGDRTGPSGAGPRTGRGAGYCSGSSAPGYANSDLRPLGQNRPLGGRWLQRSARCLPGLRGRRQRRWWR
jgi:hypothetical protein